MSAKPPLRALPIVERWDCHACGECCRGHTVLLDPADLARLNAQRWEEHPDFHGQTIVTHLAWPDRRPVIAQRADGSCTFLMGDGRCRIHADFGEPEKPWACRMFPFQVLPHEDHLRVTMRRTCPSAAAERGRPLAEHFDAVRELAPNAVGEGPWPAPPLGAIHRRPWPETRLLTDRLEAIMLDERLPLVRRLAWASRLCSLIDEAPRARRLPAAGWRDLVEALAGQAGTEAAAEFARRAAPSASAAMLFRQAASEYVRHHPNMGVRPTFRDRFGLLRAALRIARGAGALPAINPDFPAASFAELEEPLGALPGEVIGPMVRYAAAQTAALQYCGAGYRGWSVVDGFRALALAQAAGLWALRWLTRGRPPGEKDGVAIVMLLDRSHHYPLLTGGRHRRRVRTLARIGELERLLAWYAR